MYTNHEVHHDEIEHCLQLQPAGLGENAHETNNTYICDMSDMDIYFIEELSQNKTYTKHNNYIIYNFTRQNICPCLLGSPSSRANAMVFSAPPPSRACTL